MRRPGRPGSLAVTPIAIVALALLGCQAGSPATPVATTTSTAPAVPSPGGSDATSLPPDPGLTVPILEDDPFREAAQAACSAARPVGLEGIEGPDLPAVKVPGYVGLHILVLEMIREDGPSGPAPPLPTGEAYYHASDVPVVIEGSTEALPAEAEYAADVDLLACVVLESGRSDQYSGPDGEITVVALDAIVWLVDRASGALVGEPWRAPASLGTLINLDNLLRVEGSWMLPADVRTGIAYAMADVTLIPGAYQGSADGYVVAEFDAPPDLPPGTRLLPGYSFVIRLVILESAGAIDFIDLLCAPSGTVTGTPLRVATDVPAFVGRFEAESADVRIDGDFIEAAVAAGQIAAVSQRARDCGVPATANWMAGLAMSARADGDGYVLYLP